MVAIKFTNFLRETADSRKSDKLQAYGGVTGVRSNRRVGVVARIPNRTTGGLGSKLDQNKLLEQDPPTH